MMHYLKKFKKNEADLRDSKIYKIIRKILLILYALVLPFSILMAIMWPLAADTSNDVFVVEIMMLCLISFPFVLVISVLMSTILKQKSTFWLLLPLVPIIILMFFSIIADRFQFNSRIKNLPQPLSTMGLPPPATDVPVNLPPDPGEAGKKTLAGIDSDNDGVRDDLQREIVYMYPENKEVRRVLQAMVKKGQDMITTMGDHEHFAALMIKYFEFQHCYSYLVFGRVNVNRDYTNSNTLWNMIRNTPERKKIFEKNDTKGKPYIVSVDDYCDLVKDQY